MSRVRSSTDIARVFITASPAIARATSAMVPDITLMMVIALLSRSTSSVAVTVNRGLSAAIAARVAASALAS